MSEAAEAAWTWFQARVARRGYRQAMEWLLSPTCPWPEAIKEATRQRAISEAKDDVAVTQRDLTRNKRRKGCFA